MSTNWRSRFIVGVKLSEIYSETIYETEVTKYNQDTGQPFQVNVKKVARTFCGQKLPDLEVMPDKYSSRDIIRRNWDFLPSNFRNEGDDRIGILQPYSDFCNSDAVLGIVVKEFGDNGMLGQITPEQIAEATRIIQPLLQEAGYTGVLKNYIQLTVN